MSERGKNDMSDSDGLAAYRFVARLPPTDDRRRLRQHYGGPVDYLPKSRVADKRELQHCPSSDTIVTTPPSGCSADSHVPRVLGAMEVCVSYDLLRAKTFSTLCRHRARGALYESYRFPGWKTSLLNRSGFPQSIEIDTGIKIETLYWDTHCSPPGYH